jgi:hypothetical protein
MTGSHVNDIAAHRSGANVTVRRETTDTSAVSGVD